MAPEVVPEVASNISHEVAYQVVPKLAYKVNLNLLLFFVAASHIL